MDWVCFFNTLHRFHCNIFALSLSGRGAAFFLVNCECSLGARFNLNIFSVYFLMFMYVCTYWMERQARSEQITFLMSLSGLDIENMALGHHYLVEVLT